MPPRKAERRASPSNPKANRRLQHLVIECVTPELDAGRYRVKRIVGDVVHVGADIIKDGHDQLAARLLYRGPGDGGWTPAAMRFDFDQDRWFGEFVVDRIGRWLFTVEGWTDAFETWRSGLRKKVDAGQDVQVELMEGALLVRAAARKARNAVAKAELTQTANALENAEEIADDLRIERALDDELAQLMREWWPPRDLTRYARELEVEVDRERAGFAAWYEMFPRSFGTFDDAGDALPRLADLGFDVVYLPPIHPIGVTFRKGKNNALAADPGDVGSPWAIGNELGGHDAVDPRLGTAEDFERFVRRAASLGLEVALDYALQCSPDHPWVKEHPDWFHIRPDGTIQYAENPPKKYQDIYPINFWCEDRENLWNACRDVVRYWIGRGVKTFRVDNPHTKPLAFWEWLINDIQGEHPDVIFFAEAFTRPKRMKALAKLGFTMSYTYFTWKNSDWELRQYLEELTQTPMVEYFRGNFFANTPDILTEYLVSGGRPAFRARLLLAATLMPLYGIYSGFELIENVPAKPGSEEYLNSEKYEIRQRNFAAPGNLDPDIRLLNGIRRSHTALQEVDNLRFHTSENPAILFYRKEGRTEGRGKGDAGRDGDAGRVARGGGTALAGTARHTAARDVDGSHTARVPRPASPLPPLPSDADLLIAVNLDPHHVQATMVHVPIREMGIADDEAYVVEDLLTGARYTWRGARNYVRLDPQMQVGHVLRVERPRAAGDEA